MNLYEKRKKPSYLTFIYNIEQKFNKSNIVQYDKRIKDISNFILQ